MAALSLCGLNLALGNTTTAGIGETMPIGARVGRLFALCLFVLPHALLGQTLMHDNFSQDSSLNQALWSADPGLFKAIGQGGTWVNLQLGFSSSGMTMSGPVKDSEIG